MSRPPQVPLLAAALIVKDEAANLPDCLAALDTLRPLLDHVVVYDTGSADSSREIARACGAEVVEGFWDDDFSRARNAAIAAVRARWVLIVDADERVAADRVRLRAELESALQGAARRDALVVRLVNEDPDGGEQYAAPQIRIFRPDRARYAGRLHERVEPVRAGVGPLRLAEQPRDVVHVRHVGYLRPEVVAAKALRNLRLVDAELAELDAAAELDAGRPGAAGPDVAALARALYHRGRTLVTAGRIGPGAADLRRLRGLPPGAPERVWGGDVLAQLLPALGRPDELAALVGELRAEGVDPRYCDWLLARGHLAAGRFAEALLLIRGIERLVDSLGRVLDPAPVVEAQLIAAARAGEVDEAAAACIRLMAGLGRADGLGPLLLKLWGARPAGWLVELLTGADGGYLAGVAAELRRCPPPGPEIADALQPQVPGQVPAPVRA
jgi:Glycosyl transferase family 2